jgi:hypothetical protein
MIIIDTEYPGGIYILEVKNNKLVITAKNNDNLKINNIEQCEFMEKLFNKYLSAQLHQSIISESIKKISFKNYFVCLEDFRNIHYGLINDIINDNTIPIINKIGSFWVFSR